MTAGIRSMIPIGCLSGVLLAGASIPVAQALECSESTVKGSYAFGLEGAVKGVGSIAASGTTTFDGEGLASITGFITRLNGSPAIGATFDGTYTVDADTCTGSATFTIPAPGLFHRFTKLTFEAVIVNGGEEIRYLITTPGIVFAGNSVRQEIPKEE